MTFYFLLQRRSGEWAERTLGWLADVGDLGAHWEGDVLSPKVAAAAAPTPPLTFMNNLGTGEGPNGLHQYCMHGPNRYNQTMRIVRQGDRLVVHDTIHNRDVEVCCAHFSGSNKRFLNAEWLEKELGIRV